MKRTTKLGDESWKKVFAIRCRSKRGEAITPAELRLCSRARRKDPARYETMEVDVFNATVPFGSNVRRIHRKRS